MSEILSTADIATNVLLPWLLLTLIVSGLTGYRYYQTSNLRNSSLTVACIARHPTGQ